MSSVVWPLVAVAAVLLLGGGSWLWWRLRLWWAAVEARNAEWLQQIAAGDREIEQLEQARRMVAREHEQG